MTGADGAADRLVTPRFALVVASGLAYFLGLTMILPVLPRYVEGPLGGGALGVGVAVGALAAGAVVLRPFAGRLGDRAGRRVLVIGGAAVVAVTTAAYGAVESLGFLVGMMLLSGVGEAAFFVGAATMVTDLAPVERRGEAVSYWSVAVYGGVAFGPFVGELVLGDDRFGLAWAVSAALAGVAALLGIGTRDVERSAPAPEDAPLLHRAAMMPGIVLFLGLIGLAGMAAFLPLYVGDVGVADAGPFFLLYGVIILAIRVFGARLPDRLGSMRAATVSLSLVAAGMLTITAWETVAGLAVGTAVFALGMAVHYPALMLLALAGIPDSERASVVGTFSMFFDGAQGLGALVCGAFVALSGSDAAAFAAGGAAAVVGLVVLRTSPSVRARADAALDEARAARPL